MKNWKSLVSVILAIIVVVSLGCTAFAAGPRVSFEIEKNPPVPDEQGMCIGCPCMGSHGYDDYYSYDFYTDPSYIIEEYIASIGDENVKKELTGLYEAYLKALEEEETAANKVAEAEEAIYAYIDKLESAAVKSDDKDVQSSPAPEKDNSEKTEELTPELTDEELIAKLMEMADTMSYEELMALAADFMRWYTADKT